MYKINNKYKFNKKELSDNKSIKDFEELLKINKEKYDKLFNYSNDAIILFNIKSNIIDVNKKALDIFGYTKKEIFSISFSKLFSRSNFKKHVMSFKNIKKNKFITFNSEFKNKHGEKFSAEVSLYAFFVNKEKIIQCILKDITEIKNIEDLLTESLHFIEDIFNGIQDRVSIIDCNLNIIRVNNAMEEKYREKMPLIGKKCYQVFHNRKKACPKCPSLKTIKSGKKFSTILHSPLGGNPSGWIELSSYPLKNINGKVIGILEHTKDITAHIQTKEDLKKEREKAKEFLEVAGVMLVAIDRNKKVILINKKGIEILGYKNEEGIIDKNWFEQFIPKKNKKEVEEIFYNIINGGIKNYKYYENYIITKEGKEKLIAWNNTVLYDENNKVICLLSSGEDITKRRNIEKEREILFAELEKKNVELEQFIYTASHDLKSPLVTIRGFLTLLEEDINKKDTANIKEDFSVIKKSTEHMWKLLNDLLEISRVGKLSKKFEKVKIFDLVNEAVKLNMGEIKRRNINVKIDPQLPETFGDYSRLLQVFINLIDNAVKFMGDQKNPIIEIGFRKKNNIIIYFVKDNGIGIEPIYYKKIFNLFDKLDQNSSGSGIGLTIVKRIIELHNGDIWVESNKYKRGATFCFILNCHRIEE